MKFFLTDLKMLNSKYNTSILDYILIVLFILFLVLQIEIPAFLADWIDTPLGIAVIIIISIYLFLYTNPILGVLSLIVAYEILRRSSKKTGKYALTQFLPSQTTRNTEMKSMNPKNNITLEEDIVSKMAPIGVSNVSGKEIDTPFKPINEEVYGASMI